MHGVAHTTFPEPDLAATGQVGGDTRERALELVEGLVEEEARGEAEQLLALDQAADPEADVEEAQHVAPGQAAGPAFERVEFARGDRRHRRRRPSTSRTRCPGRCPPRPARAARRCVPSRAPSPNRARWRGAGWVIASALADGLGVEVVVVGIDHAHPEEIARLGVEEAVEIDQPVDFRRIGLRAGDRALLVDLVDQHLDDAVDLARPACRR